jgi:outer membrane murein-binding lipoprotein Lpp
LEEVRHKYYEQEDIIRKISGLVGEPDLGKLADRVADCISDPVELRKSKAKNERLLAEVAERDKRIAVLTEDVREKRAQVQQAQMQSV